MMINVWPGINFFMDDGGDGADSLSAAAAAGSRHVSGIARGRGSSRAAVSRLKGARSRLSGRWHEVEGETDEEAGGRGDARHIDPLVGLMEVGTEWSDHDRGDSRFR
jgi:hypothetical protein